LIVRLPDELLKILDAIQLVLAMRERIHQLTAAWKIVKIGESMQVPWEICDSSRDSNEGLQL